jgi:6-phosphogluconolactonase
MQASILICFLVVSACCWAAAPESASGGYFMYVGTYTEDGSTSKGIYVYRYDAATGKLSSPTLAAQTINPSYLVIHPNHKFLYAVNEIGNYQGKKSGAVSAFAIDATGTLKLLNQVATGGADPCYITLDKSGKYVLVANYTGGSIAVFPVMGDGRLGEASAFVQHEGHGTNPQRQEAAHAHSIDLSADNRFAIVDDLGLDETLVYKFDATKGSLTQNSPPFAKAADGAGPRHFTFDASGKFGYVVDEMGSTVEGFRYDAAAGVLHSVQTISSLPKGFAGHSDAAEILIHPSGKFLYASNRGHDSIAVFAIDRAKGTLTPVEYASTKGNSPRNFEIDPTGTRLVVGNEKSDNMAVFKIDRSSGRLTFTGTTLDLGQPVCIRFMAVK